MNARRCLLLTLILAFAFSPARAQNQNQWLPHDRDAARVQGIVFNPDGTRIMAAYFRPAVNEPGTDWRAYVIQWDLKNETRTILRNASWPIAFAPDGETVAMGIYDLSQGPRPQQPPSKLGLFTFGQVEPTRILSRSEDETIVAAGFSPEGKRIAAIADNQEVFIYDLRAGLGGESAPAKPVGSLSTEPEPRNSAVAFDGAAVASICFSTDGKYLLASVPRAIQNRAIVSAAAMWQIAQLWDGDLRGPEVRPIRRSISKSSSIPTADLIRITSNPAQLFDLAPEIAGRATKAAGHALAASDLYFSADGSRIAASDQGKASIFDRNGALLREFLAAGGAVAFHPSSRQVAIADNRGILRLWELETGRRIRTLRADSNEPETVLVAAIQFPSLFAKPERNRKELEDLVVTAAQRGASIVVLPETAVTGYMSFDIKKTWQVNKRPISAGLEGVDPKPFAETIPGPSTEFFAKIAGEYGIYLSVPLLEIDPATSAYYNSVAVLDPHGKVAIHYRKRNPWPWAEQGWASGGNLGNPTLDTPWGKLSAMICFDVHKQAPILSDLKVDTVLYSIAWVDARGSQWFQKDLPQLAKKLNLNLIAPNWTTPATDQPTWTGYGRTSVISNQGIILSRARRDLGPEIVFAELPLPDPK